MSSNEIKLPLTDAELAFLERKRRQYGRLMDTAEQRKQTTIENILIFLLRAWMAIDRQDDLPSVCLKESNKQG